MRKELVVLVIIAMALVGMAGAVVQTYESGGSPCGVAPTMLAQDWTKYSTGDNKITSDLKTSSFFNTSEDVPDNQLVNIIVPRNKITQSEAKTIKNVTVSSSTTQVGQWEETQARGVCGNCYAVPYSMVAVPFEATVSGPAPLFSTSATSVFNNDTVRADYEAQVWSNGTKKVIKQFRTDKEVLVTERIDNRSRVFYQGLPFPDCNPNTKVAAKIKETPCTECSPCMYGQPNGLGYCEQQLNKDAAINKPNGKIGFVGKR